VDAHTAFDAAAEHIGKRLRRYRRRVNDHARDLAQRERPEAARQFILRQETDEGTASEAAEPEAVNGAHPTVIAETQTELAVLTVGEAVMRMDLADQPAVMFRNRANGALNVVYRRPDGHIGWIDPGPEEKVA
jgi:hypothetical protein